eukprot:TRINITY_DN4980_c0_g1_i2.p1 TRINITY_DN4980_c0_g1~~TRINITY_DN4980_c0_g1_i2.p1  ORF type:complete len:598 (-),score=125.03 TRINITY_DN4980_c0_g1_i2:23-1753(-)
MDGAELLAQSLKAQGATHIFGVVGVPITAAAVCAQKQGLGFYGFRNEQAASYAASVTGYLTQFPGICMTVSGPGMIHALPGVLHSTTNCWPMLLISSTCDVSSYGRGAFQEVDTLSAARLYTKYAARIDTASRIPYFVEQAIRSCLHGRPGPAYLEIPANVLSEKIAGDPKAPLILPPLAPIPISVAPVHEVNRALTLIKDAKRPLVVIGKGAAYARAEEELLQFVERSGLPFLPSPMGKGVVSDRHPQCVAAARSLALQQSDVVLLVGARLNWMFNYGAHPTFNENVKFIQVDICPEEIHQNVRATIALQGDAKAIIHQLNEALGASTSLQSRDGDWWRSLDAKNANNKVLLDKQCNEVTHPLNYHPVLAAIQQYMPEDAILVNEGANTMDIGRLVLQNNLPRQRLDAATHGTMGVGLGYAIAAAVAHNKKRHVVAIQGDSAFGFCGMEVEVACRYNLPITFIVINNNGIYRGVDDLAGETSAVAIPPTVLSPGTRYDRIAEAFGGKGYNASTMDELHAALQEIFGAKRGEAQSSSSPSSSSSSSGGDDVSVRGTCILNIVIKSEGPLPKILSSH